jgi:hypothetical protein
MECLGLADNECVPNAREKRHMWNDPAVKGSLQSDRIQERCAHMSGLEYGPLAVHKGGNACIDALKTG